MAAKEPKTKTAPKAAPKSAPAAPEPSPLPELSGGAGFRVLAQYVRDLSFENPRAPESLRIEGKPEIDMGVEMNARGRTDGLFEVDMQLTVKALVQGGALFQVELVYGGLFQIVGVPDDQMEPILLVEAPRYLFPFARQIIGTATSDGGFYPPFLMDPIDFGAIYAARKAQGDTPRIGNA
jgi:preprotein translocase subunit SecB